MVANGDTANKVGTYQLAIAAKHHGIPFYVAAPSSSCDLRLETGREIVIEERPDQELTDVNGVRIAAPGKPSTQRGVHHSAWEPLCRHPDCHAAGGIWVIISLLRQAVPSSHVIRADMSWRSDALVCVCAQ